MEDRPCRGLPMKLSPGSCLGRMASRGRPAASDPSGVADEAKAAADDSFGVADESTGGANDSAGVANESFAAAGDSFAAEDAALFRASEVSPRSRPSPGGSSAARGVEVRMSRRRPESHPSPPSPVSPQSIRAKSSTCARKKKSQHGRLHTHSAQSSSACASTVFPASPVRSGG